MTTTSDAPNWRRNMDDGRDQRTPKRRRTIRDTWFITGAASGLGFELTRLLLARGRRVAATSRRLEPLTALADRYFSVRDSTSCASTPGQVKRVVQRLDDAAVPSGDGHPVGLLVEDDRAVGRLLDLADVLLLETRLGGVGADEVGVGLELPERATGAKPGRPGSGITTPAPTSLLMPPG